MSYLKTRYSEKNRPFTSYPEKLVNHLIEVSNLKAGMKRKPGESAAPEYIKAYQELHDKSYDEDLWTKASIHKTSSHT